MICMNPQQTLSLTVYGKHLQSCCPSAPALRGMRFDDMTCLEVRLRHDKAYIAEESHPSVSTMATTRTASASRTLPALISGTQVLGEQLKLCVSKTQMPAAGSASNLAHLASRWPFYANVPGRSINDVWLGGSCNLSDAGSLPQIQPNALVVLALNVPHTALLPMLANEIMVSKR